MALVYDRDKDYLWPPLLFLFRLLFIGIQHSVFSFSSEVLIGICVLVYIDVIYKWYKNWQMHWLLADLISEWHRAELRGKMKAAGIKAKHTPKLNRLLVLPAAWMILSAVMQLPTAMGMQLPAPTKHPEPWIEALAHVQSLYHPKFSPVHPPLSLYTRMWLLLLEREIWLSCSRIANKRSL